MHAYPLLGGHGLVVDRRPVRTWRFVDEVLRVRAKAGFSIDVMPNDFIGRYLYYTGRALSDDVAQLLIRLSRPGDRLLDIGANIGYVACSVLHAVPGSMVVGVEPRPDCFRLLQTNLAQWGNRGQGINGAVSDRSGCGELVLTRNTGRSHLRQAHEVQAATVKVELLTGDELVARAGVDSVDLIKVDVEGHELTVLESLGNVIDRYRPRAVVFEHFGDLASAESRIASLFRRLDYRIAGIQRGWVRWKLVAATAGTRCRDFLAHPAELAPEG